VSKQEEIKEIINAFLNDYDNDKGSLVMDWAFILQHRLHSQGVVIKIDKELPDKTVDEIDDLFEQWTLRPNYAKQLIQEELEKAGFVAVEPLVKE